MKIWTFEGGYDNNFIYIFCDGMSNEAGIVDAAVSPEEFQEAIGDHDLKPRYLFITHTHHDHTAYAGEYVDLFPGMEVCVFGHPKRWLKQRTVADGDKIKLGALVITVMHTPGHNPDSVCYLVDGALFTGDTLFVGRTGRTIGLESDVRRLYRSVYSKILTLPGDTVIYPGHNYGDVGKITIAENRKISPLLRASSEGDFVQRMDEYERSRLSL